MITLGPIGLQLDSNCSRDAAIDLVATGQADNWSVDFAPPCSYFAVVYVDRERAVALVVS